MPGVESGESRDTRRELYTVSIFLSYKRHIAHATSAHVDVLLLALPKLVKRSLPRWLVSADVKGPAL